LVLILTETLRHFKLRDGSKALAVQVCALISSPLEGIIEFYKEADGSGRCWCWVIAWSNAVKQFGEHILEPEGLGAWTVISEPGVESFF
jgi:hypothetical protein